MKFRTLFLIALFSKMVSGQYFGNYTLNFDNTIGLENLHFDTISTSNNIWEIGIPNKNKFDSALSLPNAICTDLNNPYPINDTSLFIISNIANGGFEYCHTVILAGKYKVDTDTLNDFGKIEFSPNNGQTWIDLLTDTIYAQKYCYEWWSEKPNFTGLSLEWREFYVWLAGFGIEFDIGDYNNYDTVQYRFSFISDSLQTNKDGWILDDLRFIDYVESIELEKLNTFNSIAYPNPAQNIVTISFSNEFKKKFNIALFDNYGRLLKSIDTKKEDNDIDVGDLLTGQYYYRIRHKNDVTFGIIIKQ